MKHIAALLIKVFVISIILGISLNYMTGLSFMMIGVIVVFVAGLSYVIGDLWILPRTNNMIATFSDVMMDFIIIYVFRLFSGFSAITFTSALIGAVLLGLCELFFHKFMEISKQSKDKEA